MYSLAREGRSTWESEAQKYEPLAPSRGSTQCLAALSIMKEDYDHDPQPHLPAMQARQSA